MQLSMYRDVKSHGFRIYLKKLDAHGFKKLFNLILGIESKGKCRIRDNFQALHKITLEVEKRILSRVTDLTLLISKLNEKQEKDSIFMQSCINFLLQKANDHKNYIDGLDKKIKLLNWQMNTIKKYSSYTDTKKVLQLVSDIYAITGGSCEFDNEPLESAMEELELPNKAISMDSFAKEIMQDLSCLPLYIKDEADYNAVRSDCSGYGDIIYRIYELSIDQNILDLAVAKNEDMGKLCLPLIKQSIVDGSSKEAPVIFRELLKDMKKVHEYVEREHLWAEEKYREEEKKRRKFEEERLRQKEREKEERKKNTLLLFSPSNMLTCSPDGYTEDSFEPENDFDVRKDDMDYVRKQISDFSPTIIVKPDAISETDLGINRNETHIISLADFYFCLWCQNQKQDAKIKYIALIDYYKHNLYVSWYSFDDAGKVRKKEPFSIDYKKTAKHIKESVLEQKVFLNASEDEVALWRIFESEKYIDKKFEKREVPFIGKIWRDLLRSPEKRKEVIARLYDFEHEVLQ